MTHRQKIAQKRRQLYGRSQYAHFEEYVSREAARAYHRQRCAARNSMAAAA